MPGVVRSAGPGRPGRTGDGGPDMQARNPNVLAPDIATSPLSRAGGAWLPCQSPCMKVRLSSDASGRRLMSRGEGMPVRAS